MELEKTVASNITELRKAKQWTQLELAEKLNYSDKTISKWERGDGLPDLKTICQMAELFGVSVDYFITEDASARKEMFIAPKKAKGFRTCVLLLGVLGVWTALTIIYVYVLTYKSMNYWTLFVWGVPISCFIFLVLIRKFLKEDFDKYSIPISSVFCWTLITSVYLQFLSYNIWPLFLIGVPIQAALVLWAFANHKYRN